MISDDPSEIDRTLRQTEEELAESHDLSLPKDMEQNAKAPKVPGYVLTAPIGQGAYAQVWKAWQVRTGKMVAVKVLSGWYGRISSQKRRGLRNSWIERARRQDAASTDLDFRSRFQLMNNALWLSICPRLEGNELLPRRPARVEAAGAAGGQAGPEGTRSFIRMYLK